MVAIYFATGLEQVHQGGGDDSEDITVHAIELDQVPDWLNQQQQSGKQLDPKLYAALYWLQARAK